MNVKDYKRQNIGIYCGCVAKDYEADEKLIDFLAHLSSSLQKGGGIVLSDNNSKISLLEVPCKNGLLKVAVKSFPERNWVRDKYDILFGSRAERAWKAAMALIARGIATPSPVAFLDRISRGRIIESHLITVFEENLVSFKDELINLYLRYPYCEYFMPLLQKVADATRKMHDCGIMHNDLGNQNILLRRKTPLEWENVFFVDLNRTRIFDVPLSDRQRGRDLSRIALPSDFLRIFKDMYYERSKPPVQFQRWENFYRKAYSFHHRTRRLRHPFRLLVQHEKQEDYPDPKDIWVWDDKSSQATVVLNGRDRRRNYPLNRNISLITSAIIKFPSVVAKYHRLMKESFKTIVPFQDKVGVAIEPERDTWEKEYELLDKLGCKNVLLRCYRHKGKEHLEFISSVIKQLYDDKYSVTAALIQDRYAVKNINEWHAFMESFLAGAGEYITALEIGHAVNRVKWGIWDFKEYVELVKTAVALVQDKKNIQLMGPAIIDFDCVSLLAVLRGLHKKNLKINATSVHLYVDRRGAPERRQTGFSCVEKIALNKAVSLATGMGTEKFVISEFNWPIEGTGTYSPVGSPYESPGPHIGQPNVTEEKQAAFMLRYILLAVASGMVDQVFWWRLAAHGYGLVDNIGKKWRLRPSYSQLKFLLDLFEDALFVRKININKNGIWLLDFDRPGNFMVCAAWSEGGDSICELPFKWEHGVTAEGESFGNKDGRLKLSFSPVYIFHEADGS